MCGLSGAAQGLGLLLAKRYPKTLLKIIAPRASGSQNLDLIEPFKDPHRNPFLFMKMCSVACKMQHQDSDPLLIVLGLFRPPPSVLNSSQTLKAEGSGYTIEA